MEEFSINLNALAWQIKNEAVIQLIRAFCPTKEDQMKVSNLLGIFTKYGVPAETALRILWEIMNQEKEITENEN